MILVPVAALALILGQEPRSVAPVPAAGAETFYPPCVVEERRPSLEERTQETDRPNGGRHYTVNVARGGHQCATLAKTARWWARADP